MAGPAGARPSSSCRGWGYWRYRASPPVRGVAVAAGVAGLVLVVAQVPDVGRSGGRGDHEGAAGQTEDAHAVAVDAPLLDRRVVPLDRGAATVAAVPGPAPMGVELTATPTQLGQQADRDS